MRGDRHGLFYCTLLGCFGEYQTKTVKHLPGIRSGFFWICVNRNVRLQKGNIQY